MLGKRSVQIFMLILYFPVAVVLIMIIVPTVWSPEETQPPGRQPTTQPQTPQPRTRPGRSDYSGILCLVPNLTGTYRVKSVDQAALASLPREEAFNALVAAIQGECRGRIQSQDQVELGHALCMELRRSFPLRGKARLMKLYRTSKGEEIRRIIVMVLGDHDDNDMVPAIIDGLEGETDPIVLKSVDYSLGQMTGHPWWGRTGGDGDPDWRLLTAYWRAAVTSATRPATRP